VSRRRLTLDSHVEVLRHHERDPIAGYVRAIDSERVHVWVGSLGLMEFECESGEGPPGFKLAAKHVPVEAV
jgi:hypothetical protein